MLDIFFAAAMCLLFLPLILLIAVWLRIAGGPGVFFAQDRVGRNGKTFKCLKFRTMVHDAEARLQHLLQTSPTLRAEWEASRKLANDPRIIPGIGTVLRQTSLDELPQLFNILKGDMSVVGPRPVIESELEKYGRFKRYYLLVRPGLTGPWQIGGRSNCSYEQRVELDVDYVSNWSIWRDIEILAKTALMFVCGRLIGAT